MKKRKAKPKPAAEQLLTAFIDGIASAIEAAHLDALLYGEGYLAMTADGEMRHVPYRLTRTKD